MPYSKGFVRGDEDNIVHFRHKVEAPIEDIEEDVAEEASETEMLGRTEVSAANTPTGKATPTHPSESVSAQASRFKGYTGDACPTCGHFTLIRNGTCQKCDTCGSTTGCS